jgi:hypothetical protein
VTQNPIFYKTPKTKRPSKRSAWRTAAILQTIFGGVMLLLSTCAGTFALFFWHILDVLREQGTALPLPPEITPEMARIIFTAMAILLGAIGFILLTLAVYVGRGSKPATVVSSVLMGLICIWLVINAIGSIMSPGGNAIQGLFSIVLCVAMLGLCGYTLMKLLTLATSAAPPASMAAQQYWAMVQQGNMGLGYGFPPQWMPPPGAPPVGMPGEVGGPTQQVPQAPQGQVPQTQVPQPPVGGV